MNILVVGADTHGSFQMRGVQLGGAIGARVTTKPTQDDWSWAERIVLVKRAAVLWANQAKGSGVPVVWDALDFWAQPEDNQATRGDLIRQAREIELNCGARLVIGATRAMADDIGGVYLPHHCRIGLVSDRPRTHSQVVGYDGQKKYLGSWVKSIQSACESLGLRFVVNPSDIRSTDALVSFRDGRWDGWACGEWKSGVKQVNAIVSGRPMLSQASKAQAELKPVGRQIDAPCELVDALRYVTGREVRERAYQEALDRGTEFTLEAVAPRYMAMLKSVERLAA